MKITRLAARICVFVLSIAVTWPPFFPFFVSAEFDYEVGQRVGERLSDFIETPSSLLRQLSSYRENLAFPDGMRAPDRDAFLRFNSALVNTYPEFDSIYYGLEDGLFLGHTTKTGIANYREPRESGYRIDDVDGAGDMQKYYMTCVDGTGNPIPCLMRPGESYVECVDGCSLQKCQDADSQRDCSLLNDDKEKKICQSRIKWCRSYDIKEVSTEAMDVHLKFGFVPRSTCCINHSGIPSQNPGTVARPGSDTAGNCYFTDGVTQVERYLSGDYEYCGGDGNFCNNTFVGCFTSLNYDPRWRSWYISTKKKQSPNWSPPYVFFTTLEIGITYSHPIYELQNEGGRVFAGVLAVDYTLSDISSFLIENYNKTDTIVAIIEEAFPNYMIATSLGSAISKQVLSDDVSRPCPDSASHNCKPIRLTVNELTANPKDEIISKSFLRQVDAEFPEAELVTVSIGENELYVSQTIPFSVSNELLDWRIMIMNPVETEKDDIIQPGDHLFSILIAVSVSGIGTCFSLFCLLIKNRRQREIVYSDWRFTSIFILNCALLNAASLSMIGPNNDSLCMARMWLLHLFFVVALVPLFVKIYRLYKLTGPSRTRLKSISHVKTAFMALPFVVVQIVILTIFTFVDPNKQVELVKMIGSDVTHRLVCGHDTWAFFIIELIYEGGLILTGCILAYKTRNLKKEFGEAKQLIIAMYTMALVGSIILIATNVAELSEGGKNVFVACGIFWATTISSCAFVIPRLAQIRARSIRTRTSRNSNTVHVSGIDMSRINLSMMKSKIGANSIRALSTGNKRTLNAVDAPASAELQPEECLHVQSCRSLCVGKIPSESISTGALASVEDISDYTDLKL